MDIAISNLSGVSTAYNSGALPIGASRQGEAVPSANADRGSVDNETVKKMVEEMQRTMDSMGVDLQFSTYGENQDRIAIAVTDKGTGRVIREIPSKELQNLYMKMNELAGKIFKGKV